MLLSYTYMHLYWIFGLVLRRKFIVACSVCKQGFYIDKKDARQAIGDFTSNPIPFMQRWGLAVFVAGFALVLAFSVHNY
jgi:hypothetical protein